MLTERERGVDTERDTEREGGEKETGREREQKSTRYEEFA